MDSGRRSNMTDFSNEDFYPEDGDEFDEPTRSSAPAPASRPNKNARKNRRKKEEVVVEDSNDSGIDIKEEIIGFLRSKKEIQLKLIKFLFVSNFRLL